jgi:hypothetical protein
MPKGFIDPENRRIKKPEFRRAGTRVPASRNRSSSESAGISPYDGNGSIIYFSLIDNFLLSFGMRRQGQEPSRGQGRSPRAARAEALAWQDAAF